MKAKNGNPAVVSNVFIKHWLSVIRDKSTETAVFRHYSDLLAREIITSIGEELDTETVSIDTPLAFHQKKRITDEIVLISILRSGIAIAEEALKIFPDA